MIASLSGIYKLLMNLQILERQGNIVFERSFHRIEECHSVSASRILRFRLKVGRMHGRRI